MADDFSCDTTEDALHLLMAIAICCEQEGLNADTGAIFSAWNDAYPDDALGRVGQGILKVRAGESDAGLALIDEARKTARTRADQAQDVLISLRSDLGIVLD